MATEPADVEVREAVLAPGYSLPARTVTFAQIFVGTEGRAPPGPLQWESWGPSLRNEWDVHPQAFAETGKLL